jgi:hypothetical protein
MYEFTVKGEVSSSLVSNVTAGNPFTNRYTVDNTDLDPSPAAGSFAASVAVATFPHATLMADQGFNYRRFDVHSGGAMDQATYYAFGPNYLFSLDFKFPPGTLTSDALPLTLPLPDATSAEFSIYFFVHVLRGSVNSYEGVLVPEPSVLVAAPTLLTLLRHCRTERRHSPRTAATRAIGLHR